MICPGGVGSVKDIEIEAGTAFSANAVERGWRRRGKSCGGNTLSVVNRPDKTMPRTDDHLSETDIRGPQAKTWTVRATGKDRRPWIADAPVCPLLKEYQIVHLGTASMPAPFEIVRTKLSGSYFLACFGGEGRVVVDGRLKRCAAGQAFLLPPRSRHAFHTPKGKRWEFCWVRFQENPGQQPVANTNSPVLAEFDAEPLRLAILGLFYECARDRHAAAIDQWVKLVHGYVLRFAEPRRIDDRIFRLWTKVSTDLRHPWTNAELAREVHLSEKQLERLCRRELGRTPRQQLIWLRMRRAAELLAGDGRKVATVATEVGYENPFVFSTVFKRCMGWSPSEHAAHL
jgi:AraC-like DNA-binding protein